MSETRFNYETIGNKSFLIATVVAGKDLINYQVQMLANNELSCLLPLSKRQKNEEIHLCYQVSSKITLCQATARGKISKEGFVKLILGIIAAYKEIAEYQLVDAGLVLDEDLIFIKPGTFEPIFVYLPFFSENQGVAPLREFLKGIILHSKVEVSQDNFVQVILDTLNLPTMDLSALEKTAKQFSAHSITPTATPLMTTSVSPVSEPFSIQAANFVSPLPAPESEGLVTDSCEAQGAEPVQTIKAGKTKKNKPVMAEKKMKAKKLQSQKKIPQKAACQKVAPPKLQLNMLLFLIVQAGFLAGILALLVSGTLIEPKTHSLNFSYLFGCLLAVAGIDFVLYRELFKNKKVKTQVADDAGAQKANKAKPLIPVPLSFTNTAKPVAPAPLSLANTAKPQIPTPLPLAGTEKPLIPTPLPLAGTEKPLISTPLPQQTNAARPMAHAPIGFCAPPPINQVEILSDAYVNRAGSADTVVLSGYTVDGAFLEYYNNGLVNRIILDKPSIIVGRLSSQVDHVIMDRKVGKIHAEFVIEGEKYYVIDYNSTNGTYINGSKQRIPSNTPQQIFNGDKIVLANTELSLICEPLI